MEKQKKKLLEMYEELLDIRHTVRTDGDKLYESWNPDDMRDSFKESARNFAYYLTLRRFDLRQLQIDMADFGLSSLGRLEGHVMTTLNNVIINLEKILDLGDADSTDHYPVSNQIGQEKLDKNHELLFGPLNPKRYSHIMVTMPREAAIDLEFIKTLITNGMEVARINTAHDGPQEWKAMVDNIRTAAEQLGQPVQIFFDIPGPKDRIDAIYTRLQNPCLHAGDRFFLTDRTELRNFHGHDIVVSLEEEELIQSLKRGEKVSLDDGGIKGHIERIYEEGVCIRVDQTRNPDGKKIKATKGINFPDRELDQFILTDVDKANIQFIKDYPEAVLGFSFVHKKADLDEIHQELKAVFGDQAKNIKICVKIETVGGFDNLADIIVEANRYNPASVMIARGDLAVEMGFLRLSEVQEEILWLAEASNTPVIWATQVLETMSKQGIPTRAEITDATMAGRAEVVMLNKGEHMADTVKFLDKILVKNSRHMLKKTALFRALDVAEKAFE